MGFDSDYRVGTVVNITFEEDYRALFVSPKVLELEFIRIVGVRPGVKDVDEDDCLLLLSLIEEDDEDLRLLK